MCIIKYGCPRNYLLVALGVAAELALLAAFGELHLAPAVRACCSYPPVILHMEVFSSLLSVILGFPHHVLHERACNGIGAGVYRILSKPVGLITPDPDQLPDNRLGRHTASKGEGYEPADGLIL